MRTLADIEQDVQGWIHRSSQAFERRYVKPEDKDGRTWFVKFFPPQYLAGFIRRPELVISTTAGFTWGDGVYVVPLDHVRSAMIYGRVGVMGWLDASDRKRVYDAADPAGLALYQEWIHFKPGLFTLLTTTVHAQFANRRLRNAFRRRFDIDLMMFAPDEFNRAYVRPAQDRWCVVSDFSSGVVTAGTVGFSAKIRECELVAIGTEEFIATQNGLFRNETLGPAVDQLAGTYYGGTLPATLLRHAYQVNRKRGTSPPQYIVAIP